jgi:hypothetical protein
VTLDLFNKQRALVTYKDNIMAEIDPLKTLGLVSQFRTPVSDNRALQELQTKGIITDLTNRSLERRTAATNLSGERRTGIPFGLPEPGTPAYAKGLKRLEESTLGKRGAETGSLLQRGGYAIHQPKTPRTPAQIGAAPYVGGAKLPGAAQEAEKGLVQGEQGKKSVKKFFDFDENGRFVEFTEEEFNKRKGQLKGSSSAIRDEARKLIDDANKAFPGQDIQVDKDPQTGKLILTVDGVQKERDI